MIVSGTKLTMTRGDTESLTVNIKNYEVADGDRIEMTVRKTPSATTVQFRKSALLTQSDTDATATFDIEPDDTSSMEFGTYVYDVQLTQVGGGISTIVKPSTFTVGQEVTYG